jgi:hypothetical protein
MLKYIERQNGNKNNSTFTKQLYFLRKLLCSAKDVPMYSIRNIAFLISSTSESTFY